MSLDLFDTLRGLGLAAPRGVLQVGASFGQEMNWFVDNGIRAGVFIEPLAEPYRVLSQQCLQRSTLSPSTRCAPRRTVGACVSTSPATAV